MRRKEERSKQGHTNKKVKQRSTPKAFPKKSEPSRVGFDPTTLRTPDKTLYQMSYRGISAGWVQILHLMHMNTSHHVNTTLLALF